MPAESEEESSEPAAAAAEPMPEEESEEPDHEIKDAENNDAGEHEEV
ncbi:MAG: hypothetical protein HC887_11345 [Desulfobacteraceae bacterium]|nr:hypothetical protein [Desulfobacteraceae bacterium]